MLQTSSVIARTLDERENYKHIKELFDDVADHIRIPESTPGDDCFKGYCILIHHQRYYSHPYCYGMKENIHRDELLKAHLERDGEDERSEGKLKRLS